MTLHKPQEAKRNDMEVMNRMDLFERATPIMQRCADNIEGMNRILNLCIEGLTNVRIVQPKVASAYAGWLEQRRPEEMRPEQRDEMLQRAHDSAEFARTEIENDFPTLHAYATIALWGALDVAVQDLSVALVEHDRGLLASDALARLRIRVGKYESLPQDERVPFLLREFARSLDADLKPGIGGFEAILSALNLGGEVDSGVRRTLFELSQVRNVLLHRGGVVDRAFVDKCPWMGKAVGDAIVVGRSQYERYYLAVSEYLVCLIHRLGVASGRSRVESSLEDNEAPIDGGDG